MPKLSVVLDAAAATAHRLDAVVRLLVGAAAARPDRLEIVLASAGDAALSSDAAVDDCLRRHPRMVRRVRSASTERLSALNAALAAATGDWILLPDASALPSRAALRRLLACLDGDVPPAAALVCLQAPPPQAGPAGEGSGLQLVRVDRLEAAPHADGACLRASLLSSAGLRLDGRARAGTDRRLLVLRCLLVAGADAAVAWQHAGGGAAPRPAGEPAASTWALPATYDEAIAVGQLAPLEEAVRRQGAAPRWLQQAVLDDLAPYFVTDARARAPTAVVTEPMAAVFHELVGRVMAHVEAGAVARIEPSRAGVEVRHALLSYKAPQGCSTVALTELDAAQGLVRASYFVHGDAPAEAFLVDGRPVAAAYAKYRSCRYFRRTLLRERIVWLPINGAQAIEACLGGRGAPIAIGPHVYALDDGTTAPAADGRLLDTARAVLPAGKGTLPARRVGVLSRLRARTLLWLARRPSTRREFAGAWVFVDRESEADDNAEHLYRWMREHHPGINSWFLLDPASSDWARLEKEGFRLVPPGLRRKLLLLNSEHIASSQPFFVFGGFDPRVYGQAMHWRFTFLQHGVIKDDMSHWLSDQPFDIFVTSSPFEHESIAGDDSPYTYTERETKRTGLPRHDRLLRLASSMPEDGIDSVVVMPTWRGSLATRADEHPGGPAGFAAAFAESEYARQWRALLGDEALRRVAERHGKRLVFMPHPNAAPFLEAFDPPPHVQVVTKAEAGVQPLFCRSAAMITDYSSVAFDMAYLRRPVVYFQFDRERFFLGDHNWREGYFDYDRDGFGPVARRHDEVARQLDDMLGGRGLDGYLRRMEQALPDRDGAACARVHEAMCAIGRRVGAADAAAPPARAAIRIVGPATVAGRPEAAR